MLNILSITKIKHPTENQEVWRLEFFDNSMSYNVYHIEVNHNKDVKLLYPNSNDKYLSLPYITNGHDYNIFMLLCISAEEFYRLLNDD